ncbi:hypothetical protein FA09DRAFT_183721 [Tilletiopsis washingtonensis]|uniref:Uncharacterized protein n=1 Tax=Tilletiopsis washingtonensis TaxID=58919 RepID=A0A316ZH45_9BASI|nr:hypothetical protein FA09DRAFT_183721 [Tilletiopsis washingtonensis]PWO00355.1 hypothetical protein FA09DRAFT_183721 [Tilletiopsis washingtonensis]
MLVEQAGTQQAHLRRRGDMQCAFGSWRRAFARARMARERVPRSLCGTRALCRRVVRAGTGTGTGAGTGIGVGARETGRAQLRARRCRGRAGRPDAGAAAVRAVTACQSMAAGRRRERREGRMQSARCGQRTLGED